MMVIDAGLVALISASFASSRCSNSASMRAVIARSSASPDIAGCFSSVGSAMGFLWGRGGMAAFRLLLAEVEHEVLVLLAGGQQRVAGLAGERLHVLDRTRVGGNHLQHLARCEVVQCL